jgi:fused signal recognition particle receptor
MAQKSFLEKLKTGLSKTRDALTRNLDDLFFGKRVLDHALFEELEELLIAADMGPQFAADLIEEVKRRAKRNELDDARQIKKVLQERMMDLLRNMEKPLVIPRGEPFVLMTVGVNGSGKTTTIGKLARLLKNEGHDVLLVAADTFRAAAVEQLEIWGRRVGVSVIKHQTSADPAAVVFDAMAKIKAGFRGVVIIDTAGRLHTRVNLMEELKKVRRIIQREVPEIAPEVLLILDATTGQNAVAQAKTFKDEIGVTGIVLTKLDGTSKGGVVVRIAGELALPIRYIGVGEGPDDLRVFNSADFAKAILE